MKPAPGHLQTEAGGVYRGMRPENYHPSPVTAALYRIYPDPLATQAVEAIFERVARERQGGRWHRRKVAVALAIRLPIRWLMLCLRGMLRRPRPLSTGAGYVLFLPNIGWNLPGMARVASELGDTPRIFCCPNNLSEEQIFSSLDERGRRNMRLFRFSWKHHVRFSRLPAYVGFVRCLLHCYGNAETPIPALVKKLTDAALYGIVCADLRQTVFCEVLSEPPAVIVSARPKSEYGNLPFLDRARQLGVPTYHLAHTHISGSAWFRYQVFQGGLFDGHFLFSHRCARIARERFAVTEELIVVGDPTLDDSRVAGDSGGANQLGTSPARLCVMYAASSDYGRYSMRDVVEVTNRIDEIVLRIKTRPPGNNKDTVYRFLDGCDLSRVEILDHARVGRIEDILADVDLVIGSVSNGILSALARGVPAISYIPASDWQEIEERGMEPLPYAEFGITVIDNKPTLEVILADCVDPRFRQKLYEAQRDKMESMYPNIDGPPAARAICACIKQHL